MRKRNNPPRMRKVLFFLMGGLILIGVGVVSATVRDMSKLPSALYWSGSRIEKLRLSDRNGKTLSGHYLGNWNTQDQKKLHEMPDFLKRAFVFSEDRRFYRHHGIDLKARLGVLLRLTAFRGASSITEQVVRILNPRPRTYWSKWLEMVDAARLEKRFSKEEIFAFYLNQVPYAAHRRGVTQAAKYYFGRDLDTLTKEEMLLLVVLVRAPSKYDLHKNDKPAKNAALRLAEKMVEKNEMSEDEFRKLEIGKVKVEKQESDLNAVHFIRFVRDRIQSIPFDINTIKTTLDGELQSKVQNLLNMHLKNYGKENARNGAVFVADHRTGEILAWVSDEDEKTKEIDKLLVPRQPGSVLKPFVYGLALEKGWTAATLIDDSPLALPAGTEAYHVFRNYADRHHGWVTLRDALGNSLNIPAIHAVQYVGADVFVDYLREMGITTLSESARFYGDGLVLGNGEIPLYEVLRSYAVIAGGGVMRDFVWTKEKKENAPGKRMMKPETALILTDILADPHARMLEFQRTAETDFNTETAYKTGTSTSHRDALAIGYDARFIAGVWMGNMDFSPMNGVTGARGPVPLLRDVLVYANRLLEPLPLRPSKPCEGLVKARACIDTECTRDRDEWFVKGTEPKEKKPVSVKKRLSVLVPAFGMHLALDPRKPKNRQKLRFEVAELPKGAEVTWVVNGEKVYSGMESSYDWQMNRGKFTVDVLVMAEDRAELLRKTVEFTVK